MSSRNKNPKVRPLWRCPKCRRPFANRNQSHSCGHFTVREQLKGKNPQVISLYRRFAAMVRRCGPVILAPTKTLIGFQVKMAFADVMFKRNWLDAYVILARRLENPRFTLILSLSPRNHIHYFRIRSPNELDREVMQWLREAYKVGRQEHLARRREV
ncbi:MAG: DUF5655 domain-containing protein [Acidobacteriia bacterium]|nr:DUF5655 domain-containing protein [Terriglobia bacterium]